MQKVAAVRTLHTLLEAPVKYEQCNSAKEEQTVATSGCHMHGVQMVPVTLEVQVSDWKGVLHQEIVIFS